MNLPDAMRMILAESAAYPELMRVARDAYDDLAAGRRVHHATLSWVVREASRKDLYGVLIRKHGAAVFDDVITVLCREIDRQAPVPSR
ncbi:hypothetical protein GCM10010402_13950 [Actinomadura luteofluorescens]|uniref:Uncharacterized protein n=1 Tax=Actinomadura luteofluorescens TaxID=46163 RepID=A0A7Y9EIE7_9ACTN|nr:MULTISPECIES: hypothetical protein [Actinomadura]MCR3739716.1 hypothetical protein [Actinomadura glauciflava]NYD48272.1 hypothetical protein [Actinomadura luteofluorescens]